MGLAARVRHHHGSLPPATTPAPTPTHRLPTTSNASPPHSVTSAPSHWPWGARRPAAAHERRPSMPGLQRDEVTGPRPLGTERPAFLGIDSSRPSPPRPDSSSATSRRYSSISLEGPVCVSEDHSQESQGDLTPTPHDAAKSPLLLILPQELYSTTQSREVSPEDACPLLPSDPSTPSTPSVTNPMDVYLQDEDRHEMRMMRLRTGVECESASHAQDSPPEKLLAQSLFDGSSWQIIDKSGDDQTCPPGPTSRPGKGRRIDEPPTSPSPRVITPQINTFERMSALVNITPESNESAWDIFPKSPDSGISDLSLSAGPPAKRQRGPIDPVQLTEEEPTLVILRAKDRSAMLPGLVKMTRMRKREEKYTGNNEAS
ncbi:hypothetical protein G7Z17_g10062 [Cylindrodendrum hubeiense]|uniref:Uncharacterized protein n=1 Tax=Cylindrodendrum hubeiense TaxID=595255 RepID=A0A9P5L541_9HYPO|nr:hypothetical protein G7Z17_g10062 [Cylindrodendrum hubeiense]